MTPYQFARDRFQEIARKILGEPNPARSTRDEWRWGTNGSLSLIVRGPKAGAWKDYETGEGGGPWELLWIKGQLGSNDACRGYLEREFGFDGNDDRQHIIKTYVYTDEQGAPLFRVQRWGPLKKFSQESFKDGQWHKGKGCMAGVRLVPYHLPELVAALAKRNGTPPRVYIVEGEKDVDRVRSDWAVTATTCPGGAGKWRKEYDDFFVGLDVVIIVDSDATGRKHGKDVAGHLAPVAAAVRIVELQGVGEKGDISNWLDAGGSQSDLETIIEQTEAFTPTPPPTPDNDLGEWDFGAAGIVPAELPPRGWLLGTWICRQFLSALFGDGAVGKTATRIACALALATGRSAILDEHVVQRCKILFICFEDGEIELKRRVCAAMMHHRVSNADIAGYLFVRAITKSELKLATSGEYGAIDRGPLVEALKAAIIRRQIDVVFLDPLIKVHAVNENDNRAMDLVADILVDLAVEHNLAVDTPHHITKGTGSPGNADSGRGASAIKDGGRLIYTQTPMSEAEAKTFGISPDDRLQYVRVDQGKVNLTRRSLKAKWLRLVGVKLGNSNELYPSGDEIQTVEPWNPPKDIVSASVANRVLDRIDEGPAPGRRYSPAAQTRGDRDVIPAILETCSELNKKQAAALLHDWLKNGVLIAQDYQDPIQRSSRKGLFIGTRPGLSTSVGNTTVS